MLCLKLGRICETSIARVTRQKGGPDAIGTHCGNITLGMAKANTGSLECVPNISQADVQCYTSNYKGMRDQHCEGDTPEARRMA